MTSSPTLSTNFLKGKRLLIADDLEGNRVLGTLFLNLTGAEIEVVTNGADAVQKALDHSYDAIFMDIHMPELDGLSATQWLREKGFKNPIFVMSCDCRVGMRERAFESGANSFISKPLSMKNILQTLSHFFAKQS